jgi:GNAT superfamily N-acetyltransferase
VSAGNIQIIKVDDAAVFIADLFQQTFGAPPPSFPTHYVAFLKKGSATFEAIGYYHVTYGSEYALVGGLCVDRHYRNKGIGEKLERIVLHYANGK